MLKAQAAAVVKELRKSVWPVLPIFLRTCIFLCSRQGLSVIQVGLHFSRTKIF